MQRKFAPTMTRILLTAAVATTFAGVSAQDVFVDLGETWRFFRGAEAPSVPPEAWRDPGFLDGSWESGAAPIGYEYGFEGLVTLNTELDDMQGSYLTVYARTTFDLTQGQIDGLQSLLLSIDWDDGFIAYLNGVEIARSQMGAALTEFAFDDASAALREGGSVAYFDVSASLGALGAGENLLALEVHNTSFGSSDFSFDARLSGDDARVDCPTGLACASSLDGVTLSWTNSTAVAYDSITVTRDGTPIPGSPFLGSTETVTDTNPGDFLNTYEVRATVAGADCSPLRCRSNNNFTLIDIDEEWRFARGDSPPSTPATAWRGRTFDDGLWETGATGIGYDDGDDVTVLDDMRQRADDPATPGVDESQPGYAAFFARKTFNLPDSGLVANLTFEIDYDDGFVAYLNGTEIARSANMEDLGADVPFDALATAGREATGDFTATDVSAAIGSLVSGDNVLAVEVHNVELDSSDASFIPRLTANDCFSGAGLACDYDEVADEVTISFDPIASDSVEVTRNGVRLPGSPFPGGTSTIVDSNPTSRDNLYEIRVTVGGRECPVSTCQVNCEARDPEALSCELSLVGGSTQAALSWTTPAGTTSIEVRREGTLVATLGPGDSSYVDADVEAEEPEDDTEFDVTFIFDDGETCTIGCAPRSLCPEPFLCEVVESGGAPRARLSWGNIVKEWEVLIVQRDGVEIAALFGDETSFVDEDFVLTTGEVHDYTLIPTAPLGEEVDCEMTCTLAAQFPEIAVYDPPAGGWDYSIDFEDDADDRYNPASQALGNLDGNWIRASIDQWDGSAPEEVGAAPGGPAPGGIEIETTADGSPCEGGPTGVLRILDPGDPSAPGGSLSTVYPDPYDEPSNRSLFLGFDTGIADRNLLRDGVTFAARWRIRPTSPEYLAASASGDGTGLDAGRGQVGIYFVDDGTLGTEGDSAALSFALNSGDELQMSTDPTTTVPGIDIDLFRSLWVTVQDPEGDDTFAINVYLNGQTSPTTLFGTGTGVELQAANLTEVVDMVDVPYFGSSVGNFLAIGQSNAGTDSDVQIDYVAYKAGVHAPTVTFCEGQGRAFRRGDINDDATLNLTDGINLLNFLFLGGPDTTCKETQDTNNDGTINLTDGIGLFNFLFLGGPPPASPGPSCGFDVQDANQLGCVAYTNC